MPEGRDLHRPDPGDPSRLRVSDRERHAVADVLREAAGEGRLDLAELDERLEAAYAARTYADLVLLTADLPASTRPGPVAPSGDPARPPVLGPAHAGSFALMSETRRTGPWQVGTAHWAFALMGSVVLDLRQAVFAGREVALTATALMGGVEIVVDPHTHVLVTGVGVMGEFNEERSSLPVLPRADSPVVRVRGLALMGSVVVKRREPPGRSRSRS